MRSRRPRMIRPRLGSRTSSRRSCQRLAHRAPRCLRRRRARGENSRINSPYRKAGIQNWIVATILVLLIARRVDFHH